MPLLFECYFSISTLCLFWYFCRVTSYLSTARFEISRYYILFPFLCWTSLQDLKCHIVIFCFHYPVGLSLLIYNLPVALKMICMIASNGIVRKVQYPLLNLIGILGSSIYTIPQPCEFEIHQTLLFIRWIICNITSRPKRP